MARKPEENSTIDPAELAKFSAIADQWWDPDGKFKPLHIFNPTRLAYIRAEICHHFGRAENDKTPLKGLKLLDIGCGGGLLCEPMTRLGANVTGVDAAEANIKTAALHAEQQQLNIDYRATSAEALAAEGAQFDVILNMEVVEHVADVQAFMAACSQMVKPGGLMFFATLNRTAKAFALAIVGAEYVLRWLPRGTHDWHKFITPDELTDHLVLNGLETKDMTGVSYAPLSASWHLSADMSVNYMGVACKP